MPASDPLSMLQRQLAHSVKHGRRITMHVFDGDPVTGYLAGWDDDGYLILEPRPHGYHQFYIRKVGNPHIEFHTEHSYQEEPDREKMDRIVGPFRSVVLRLIDSRPATRPAAARKAG